MAGKFPAVQALNLVMFTQVAAATSTPEASAGWSRANFREAFAEHPGEAQVQLVMFDASLATWAPGSHPEATFRFIQFIHVRHVLMYHDVLRLSLLWKTTHISSRQQPSN